MRCFVVMWRSPLTGALASKVVYQQHEAERLADGLTLALKAEAGVKAARVDLYADGTSHADDITPWMPSKVHGQAGSLADAVRIARSATAKAAA